MIDESQWVHIVDFMRKNPKLMLQMLPGTPAIPEEVPMTAAGTQQAPFNLSEEAKKLAKLKALTSKFANNRKGFLEAIDKIQENPVSSPKVPAPNKEVKVKSISQN